MADKLHTLFTIADGIHILQAWTVADYAARDALTITSSDVGRVAEIEDDHSFWIVCEPPVGEADAVWRCISSPLGDYALAVGSANAAGSELEVARVDHVHDASSKADARYTINAQTGTSYALTDAVNGQLTTLDNAAAIAVTVSGLLTVGSVFPCLVLGAGQVTFSGTDGLTVQPPPGLTLKSRGQYARLTVEIVSATLAVLSGDVAVI